MILGADENVNRRPTCDTKIVSVAAIFLTILLGVAYSVHHAG